MPVWLFSANDQWGQNGSFIRSLVVGVTFFYCRNSFIINHLQQNLTAVFCSGIAVALVRIRPVKNDRSRQVTLPCGW